MSMLAGGRIAPAQLASFGVAGGVPMLNRTSNASDESRPYIIGPSIEFRLPAGFALEAAGLYQRVGNNHTFQLTVPAGAPGPGITFLTDRLRGNSWQFPLLGKYYFRRRTAPWQPFIGTGWSFRAVGVHQAIKETIVDASGASRSFSFKTDSRADAAVGAVFAAGLRYRAGGIAFTPELRYTRWGSSSNFSLNKNEAAFLLGIHF